MDPFDTFTHEAFRVESLPLYADTDTGESAELEYYKRHGSNPSEHNSEWAKLVHDARQRGGQILRLRLVSRPLSDYEYYELLAGYDTGVAAGEQIRVTYKDEVDSANSLEDYWLYDNRTIELLHYSNVGLFQNSTIREITKKDRMLIRQHRNIFEKSQSLAAFVWSLQHSSR